MSDPSTFREPQGRPERVEGRAEARSDWAPELRARLSSLRLVLAREAEIIEELSQHLDDRRQELIAGGASREQATRMVLDEFHPARLVRYLAPLRQSRLAPAAESSSTHILFGGLVADLRQAVRELRAAPGFTVVASWCWLSASARRRPSSPWSTPSCSARCRSTSTIGWSPSVSGARRARATRATTLTPSPASRPPTTWIGWLNSRCSSQ